MGIVIYLIEAKIIYKYLEILDSYFDGVFK